jgi:hypothetical protein
MSELATITITILDDDIKLDSTLPMPETNLVLAQAQYMIVTGQFKPEAE